MTTEQDLRDIVEGAAESIPRAWPLHSFVTANPLAGFEHEPFPEAVRQAEELFGGRGYPEASVFDRALREGRIDDQVLSEELAAHGFDAEPAALLERADSRDRAGTDHEHPAAERVDRLMAKWLSAFLDEGRANWSMPDREDGFYHAFRKIAPHDGQIPDNGDLAIPEHPTEALAQALAPYPEDEWRRILEHHLAALPGWTQLIKRRQNADDPWQEAAPIDLFAYAAARLALADHLDAPIEPPTRSAPSEARAPVEEAFLAAWERTYREDLVESVQARARAADEGDERPTTQLAFCIDTRSEVLRRHLEDVGDHETHGYAGFFGVPIEYEAFSEERSHGACPPILTPEHPVEERPTDDDVADRYEETTSLLDTALSMVTSLKKNPATAFPFVEHTGAGYGAALSARTLVPGRVRDLLDRLADRVPSPASFCEPSLEGLDLDAQIEYAANAFHLMGIDTFAPVFVFVGHASETANNPFDASLDCGACAGNPGGPNARLLARICNREPVREALAEVGIEIPEDTVFLAAEHTTTTDEVAIFPSPERDRHAAIVDELAADLAEAGQRTAAERWGADDPAKAADEARRRAADWSQTRPEWGLAGNAAFVIARREVPAGLDLDGRAFLHSYDWRADDEGNALEAILTGPWVVTEWINMHYYFASVDNATWGSGSKVTQTPVGNVVTVQGNGGDAATGLPKESLVDVDGRLQHQPLRLSTVVEAPVDRVRAVLAEHDHLEDLVANGWLSLTVVDPTRDHEAVAFQGDRPPTEAEPEAAQIRARADEHT